MPYPQSTVAPPPTGPIPPRPSQVETLEAVHDLLAELVAPVRAQGPLPSLDSQEFLDAPRHVKAAVMLVLGAAYLLENPHAERARGLRDASHDVAGAAVWRGYAERHMPHEELRRQRASTTRLVVGADGRAHHVRLDEQGAA